MNSQAFRLCVLMAGVGAGLLFGELFRESPDEGVEMIGVLLLFIGVVFATVARSCGEKHADIDD